MGIIDRLKKGKKSESVLDSLTKKKEPKEAGETIPKKPDDIEVRELSPAPTDKMAAPESIGMQPLEEKPIREFRTGGMHEFELDSLGASGDANIKVEYKAKINQLIDKSKIDEAINLLQELKGKLSEQK